MTLADIARFAVIIALGILAFIVFLIAGTLIGLMYVDPEGCRCVYPFPPVGLYTLGVAGALLLLSMARAAAIEAPPKLKAWGLNNTAAIATGVISLVVLLLVFW